MKSIELTGSRFSKLLVLRKAENKRYGNSRPVSCWVCKCDCGNIVERTTQDLKRGLTTNCGCSNLRTKDLSGNKYWKLTVIKQVESFKGKRRKWECLCHCGNKVIKSSTSLTSGEAKSCGCWRYSNPNQKRGGVEKGTFIQKEFVGKTIGKLTILERVRKPDEKKSHTPYWLCKCECGNTKIVSSSTLKNKTIIASCGCVKRKRGSGVKPRKPKKLKKIITNEDLAKRIFGRYKRGSEIRGLEFELTFDEFKSLIENNCNYCGIEPQKSITSKKALKPYRYNGVDRVNNIEGYTRSNSVSACTSCNYRKKADNKEDFLDWVSSVYKHSILNTTSNKNG